MGLNITKVFRGPPRVQHPTFNVQDTPLVRGGLWLELVSHPSNKAGHGGHRAARYEVKLLPDILHTPMLCPYILEAQTVSYVLN